MACSDPSVSRLRNSMLAGALACTSEVAQHGWQAPSTHALRAAKHTRPGIMRSKCMHAGAHNTQ